MINWKTEIWLWRKVSTTWHFFSFSFFFSACKTDMGKKHQ